MTLPQRITIFLVFLSAAFSITYWAIAKYDVTTDYSACGDAQYYIQMSHMQYRDVPRPYRYRIIMPSLVYLVNKNLHIEHFLEKYYENVDKKIDQLNFGIINILSLTCAAFVLLCYCVRLGFSKEEGIIGGFLFLTSFFVVNYYTVPMVDSLSSFFIISAFYAVLADSLVWLFLSFTFGIFTKEALLVIPLLILLVERRLVSKKLLVCLPTVALFILFVVFFPVPHSNRGAYILNNMTDLRLFALNMICGLKSINLYTLIEHIQTYLVLWLLMIYAIVKCKLPVFLKRALWLLVLIVIIPPIVGSSAVGRVSFYLFPVAIPLSLLALKDILKKNSAQTA